MSVGIYTDIGDVKDLDNVDQQQVVYYDWSTLDSFKSSKHDIKICVLIPDYSNPENFHTLSHQLQSCDLCVIYSMELREDFYYYMQKFDKPNFVFIVNGMINQRLTHATLLTDLIWFRSTSYPYLTDLKHLCRDRLRPFAEKPYAFDVLYGRPRPHRKFARQFLSQFDDRPWFYQSSFHDGNWGYIGSELNWAQNHLNWDETDFWEDDMVVDSNLYLQCTYHGFPMIVGQVLPFKVYSKTSFSLVCETETSNQISFFTEKTVKPILAHRLFVVLSGQYFLRNLRSLGFKTFDTVIDESYDEIEDEQTRWRHALDQCISLCEQKFETVMPKILPIVLHNYSVLSRLDHHVLNRYLEMFLIARGYHKK